MAVGLLRLIYSLLAYLSFPLVLANLLWRGFRNPAYWSGIGERLGFGRRLGETGTIWIHAVSVGEVQASIPLVNALKAQYPARPILMTTVTPTGADRVKALFPGEVEHRFIPYDMPGAVRRFFRLVKPSIAVILETELWPNLYRECGLRQVPLVLASARISPLSVHRYRWLSGLFSDALSNGIVIAAQSQGDADRFLSLGAAPERTRVTGNIKFDIELSSHAGDLGRDLRERQAKNRAVWIAASTHEGEDEKVLQAHQAVRESDADALLILVPRHPERFDRVAQLIKEMGFTAVRRSKGEIIAPDTAVYLADTLGELIGLYSAADVAFVAGSLVPIGGHNLLEPAALGIPIIAGPHNHNAQEIADELEDASALEIVENASQLGQCLVALFADAERRAQLAEAAFECLKRNRGSVDRLMELLTPLLLGERTPPTPASRPLPLDREHPEFPPPP